MGIVGCDEKRAHKALLQGRMTMDKCSRVLEIVRVSAVAGMHYDQTEDGTCISGGCGNIVPGLGEEQTEVGGCTAR